MHYPTVLKFGRLAHYGSTEAAQWFRSTYRQDSRRHLNRY